MHTTQFNSKTQAVQLINGYVDLIESRVSLGWDPFLITLMFKSLRGSRTSVVAQMLDEVDRVYSTFVTRVVRNPGKSGARDRVAQYFYSGARPDNRPLLVACLDGPCRKNDRKAVVGAAFNGGLHIHGLLVVPRISRLTCDVLEHFEKYRNMYVRNRLLRFDVRPIVTQLSGTVDYALKGLKAGYSSLDDIAIYPKAMAEG